MSYELMHVENNHQWLLTSPKGRSRRYVSPSGEPNTTYEVVLQNHPFYCLIVVIIIVNFR